MRVTYELKDVFKIEELCDFISRIKKDGILVVDYIINKDTGELYTHSTDSCEEYSIIVEQHNLTLDGFTAEKSLDYFNIANDCFGKDE